MSRILTIEQAAEMLQLNPQVVRQYLRTGKLPGAKIGRHWRIVEEDLLGFIRQQHVQSRESDVVAETAARYQPEREWKTLSREEKIERIRAVQRMFARPDRSVDDLLREKHEEIEEEERRWEEKHRR